ESALEAAKALLESSKDKTWQQLVGKKLDDIQGSPYCERVITKRSDYGFKPKLFQDKLSGSEVDKIITPGIVVLFYFLQFYRKCLTPPND
ncbi:unnamed protein product, partial [Haemonchus placei]|uniref:ABC transporter substrate-binding protein n=1 Tax=Haemonchus placei TaxID=6290 RepID=A0A0N4XBH9_HAEPC